MKKQFAKVLGAVALSVLGGSAFAQQPAVQPAPMPQTTIMAAPAGQPCGQHWVAPSTDCGCNTGCADDCNRGGLYFEAAILYLKPRWDNNEAYSFGVQVPDGTPFGLSNNVISTNFDPNYDFMPRISAGFSVGDGFGGRVRWQQGSWDDSLNTSVQGGGTQFIRSATPLQLQTASQVFVDGNGIPVDVNAQTNMDLRILTWDFEATKDAKIAGFDVTFSGGARYLHLSQDYRMFMQGIGADGAQDSALLSGLNLNGVGPTFAIDARASLMGGLGAYGTFRQSIIFANGKQAASATTRFVDFFGDEFFNVQSAYQERDTVIPITELEVGGEYKADMGRSELFLRAGFVGHVYFSAGNSSRSGNTANESNSNLGLVGVVLSGGVRY